MRRRTATAFEDPKGCPVVAAAGRPRVPTPGFEPARSFVPRDPPPLVPAVPVPSPPLHATGSPVTAHTPRPDPGCASGFAIPATSHSASSQCVCILVFTTSMGVVTAAAKPPATPPAVNCVKNVSSSTSPPRNNLPDSYAAKCMAVNGTFMASVVGYERYNAPSPCERTVRRAQSHTPVYGDPHICRRCLMVSTGVCTASPMTVAAAPANACRAG